MQSVVIKIPTHIPLRIGASAAQFSDNLEPPACPPALNGKSMPEPHLHTGQFALNFFRKTSLRP